ncbi:UNVERIFIED_CONTAM: hypothetical protein Slati_0180300 [Sesamum latifolium]|uniref:DUF4283 domain-containing protein n=1 Tax=Sesamum latifolium TaxID=2727402 RepID=A0AAW2YAT6_9LAMI
MGSHRGWVFLRPKPSFHQVNTYFRLVWPSVRDVIATSNGFFFIQFKSSGAMDEVIEGGPWLFQDQPIVLQRWEPGIALCKHSHTQVPVWIKLRHLSIEFWTKDGLSGVGRPVCLDAITKACMRLNFARVCLMLDYGSTLQKHLVVVVLQEDGSGVPCLVDVEYEWILEKCLTCRWLGHSISKCPTTEKPIQPL